MPLTSRSLSLRCVPRSFPELLDDAHEVVDVISAGATFDENPKILQPQQWVVDHVVTQPSLVVVDYCLYPDGPCDRRARVGLFGRDSVSTPNHLVAVSLQKLDVLVPVRRLKKT